MSAELAPVYVEPTVTAGFLTLTVTSETGAPTGKVYVNRDKVLYMQRIQWVGDFTRVWLAGDCHLRVAETPEEILEALD